MTATDRRELFHGLARFEPRLEILPARQRAIWPRLGEVPPHFVLYGGTALSLRLAHRRSVDFDFFSTRSFAPGDLLRSTPLLGGGTPLRSSPDTLTVEVDGVVLSFFGALNLGSVGVPEVAADNDVPVASLLDLAATKVKAVVDRAEAKDYLDIAALTEAGIPLADALGAARAVFGPGFNEVLPLKALAFFEEGDLPSLPKSVRRRLIEAVARVRKVPQLERRSNGLFPDEIERRLAMV